MAPPYDIDVARARIERVFRYLQELHRIRTPPILDIARYDWILRLDQLPRHTSIRRGFDAATGTAAHRGFVLSVDRPSTDSECPAPSVLFANWLEPGWEQPGVPPAVYASRHHKVTDREEAFEDNEARVLAFEEWLESHRARASPTRD